MSWDDVSFAMGSPLCRKILECLEKSDKPLAPLQIADITGIARSNVSTKLGYLLKKKLVKCENPEARKWRFYTITKKGKGVLEEVTGISKDSNDKRTLLE